CHQRRLRLIVVRDLEVNQDGCAAIYHGEGFNLMHLLPVMPGLATRDIGEVDFPGIHWRWPVKGELLDLCLANNALMLVQYLPDGARGTWQAMLPGCQPVIMV